MILEMKMEWQKRPWSIWAMRFTGFLLVWILTMNASCQNPHEWQPGDPQVPPPGPTVIISPPPNSRYIGAQEWVTVDWRVVSGAENYELQSDTTAEFTNPASMLHDSPPVDFLARVLKSNSTTYYLRVRAGSPAWTWWTDWSPTDSFYIFIP